MSFDLRVWTRKMAGLGAVLPAARGWAERGGLRVLEGRAWQITVYTAACGAGGHPLRRRGASSRLVVGRRAFT